jgi:protein-disulfide isomerase
VLLAAGANAGEARRRAGIDGNPSRVRHSRKETTMSTPNRRRFTARMMLLGTLVVGAVLAAQAPFAAARAQGPNPQELAQPGALGDVAMGSNDAKVTIIEYASLTCPHCAEFHKNVLPTLKSKYIDTGKVRYILREFPLDDLATAGFMLARCAGDEKYYAIVDLLFDKQQQWAFSKRPLEALFQLVKQAGFTQESAESCLKNQKIYAGVTEVMKRGSEKFQVNSTPTFFINGQLQRGVPKVEELDKVLAPFVEG